MIKQLISQMDAPQNIQTRALQKLQKAISWSTNRHQQILKEIMMIEKVLNNVKDAKPILKAKQAEKQIEKEEQVEDTTKYQKKYEQMIMNAEEQLKNIYTAEKKTKTGFNKQKFVEPLPAIQKKPPVPTNNRTKQPQTHFPKPNPYRHKNEVTPKITQTPISTSKKSHSNSRASNQATSVQDSKNSTNSLKKTINKREANSTGKIQEKQTKTQKMIQFERFPKSIEQILGMLEGKGHKSTSRKGEIDRLFGEYQKEALGHKQNLKKYELIFLKDFAKIAALRQILPIQTNSTNQAIEDRYWEGHTLTFKFTALIENLENILHQNPISEQYRMQAKICHQIISWYEALNSLFSQEIYPAKSQLKLPPKLGISLQMKPSLENSRGSPESQNGDTNQSELDFYELIYHMLQQIKEMQSFDKWALSKLRTLISIVLFEGRRSLTLVQADKYEDWRSYYLQN